jgi:purine-binding chemotaxis protein CheW
MTPNDQPGGPPPEEPTLEGGSAAHLPWDDLMPWEEAAADAPGAADLPEWLPDLPPEAPPRPEPPSTLRETQAGAPGEPVVDTPPAGDIEAMLAEAARREAEAACEDDVWQDPEEAEPSQRRNILEELFAQEERDDVVGFGVWGPGRGAAGQAGPQEQHVIFTLAGTDYAVPIANVLEVGPPPAVTPLPHVPDWLVGLTNLRGDIISVVDLGRYFELDCGSRGRRGRMLVAHSPQDGMTTGLLVDAVKGMRYLAADRIQPMAGRLENQVLPFIRGVCDHQGKVLVVLDLERVLHASEMRQFEPV